MVSEMCMLYTLDGNALPHKQAVLLTIWPVKVHRLDGRFEAANIMCSRVKNFEAQATINSTL